MLGVYGPGDLCARAGAHLLRQGLGLCGSGSRDPGAGDFKRSCIGDTPVVVVRDEEGRVNAVENRCAHRGVQFCQSHLGHVSEFMCPYHQWTYTLQGDLTAVPFRHGIRGQGGMPLVSVDDGEVVKFSQDGLRSVPQGRGVMEMGGRDWQELEPHMVTEGAIRAFYDYYRRVMGL